MARFNVVDTSVLRSDKVIFGATVELLDLETDEERRYTLVGPDETDFAGKGSISVFSPVGRALLGKNVGDEASVDAPRGKILYEITALSFNGPFVSL